MRNLIFVGLPGSGKSTVGRLAARTLGLPFVDADKALEQAEGRHGTPGAIVKVDRRGVFIACGEGVVRVLQVQAAGGKRMPADAYFRGHQALLGEVFC